MLRINAELQKEYKLSLVDLTVEDSDSESSVDVDSDGNDCNASSDNLHPLQDFDNTHPFDT